MAHVFSLPSIHPIDIDLCCPCYPFANAAYPPSTSTQPPSSTLVVFAVCCTALSPPPPTQPFHCLYSSSRFPYRVSLASLTRLIVENQSQSLPVSKPFPSFLTKPHRTTHILIHPSFVPPSLSSLCLRFSATPCLLIAKVFFHFSWLH